MKRQQGVALVAVLLVFAIATVIVSRMVVRAQADFQRASNYLNGLQADFYALGGEQLAIQLLRQDWQNERDEGRPHVDYLTEAWALPNQVFELDDGRMVVTIRDLQARLSINRSLDDPAVVNAVQRLVRSAGGTLEASALQSWLRPASGTEPGAMPGRSVPYQRAHRPMADVSELRLLGVEAQAVAVLRPWLMALPEGLSSESLGVNVNTAPVEVLAALDPALEQLVPARESSPYTREKLDNIPLMRPELRSLLDVRSSFFEVTIDVEFDGYRRRMVSIVRRLMGNDETRPPRMEVIRRTMGYTDMAAPERRDSGSI